MCSSETVRTHRQAAASWMARAQLQYMPGLVVWPEEWTVFRRYVGELEMDCCLETFNRLALKIGPAGASWYTDYYSFEDNVAALEALEAWDGHTEPEGWVRHMPSARRRPDGDKSKEYVRE